MVVTRFAAALAVLGSIVACQEPITQPAAPPKPSLSGVAQLACPANPKSIVRSEAELHAALASASPGDVIAVDGFFDVGDAIIRTDDVTLTCATPGSGLRGRGDLGLIVKVIARRVTVSDLVLDATSSVEGAYVAFYNGVTDFGEDIRFLRNTVSCGATNKCVFFGSEVHAGARGGLVADNHITVAGAKFGGVTIQGVDGGRVERNTIAATAPSAHGILANGNANVVVSNNVVRGPWANSLFLTDGFFFGVVDGNDLSGATGNAVRMVAMQDARFTNNSVACGLETCAIFDGAFDDSRTIIADNRFESSGSILGVQLLNMNGVRMEHNTISVPALASAVEILGTNDAQFVKNTVRCGDACIFADFIPRAVIADNYFESAGSSTGVHLQDGVDGARIERNTIIATAPSTVPNLGGIRARDGRDVVIAHNTVLGPWANSIALADLADSHIEQNRLEGASRFGAVLGLGVSFRPVSMTGNVVQGNQVTGASGAGIWARSACSNTFLGNMLQGNAPDRGLVFTEMTGANTYVGNRNVVIDNGDFDCDGDGVSDANIVTGPGLARRGATLGGLVKEAAGPPGSKLR